MAAEVPGEQRSQRADEQEQRPGVRPFLRRQQPRQQCRRGERGEDRGMGQRHRPAARLARHHLGDVGVHDDVLGPDTGPRQQARDDQQDQARRRAGDHSQRIVAQPAGERRQRVQKQHEHETDAPAEVVAGHAEQDGAEEHAQRQRRHEHAQLREPFARVRRQHAGPRQDRGQRAGDEVVVDVEPDAERDESEKAIVKTADRQAIEASGDLGGGERSGHGGRVSAACGLAIAIQTCPLRSTLRIRRQLAVDHRPAILVDLAHVARRP